MSQKRDRNESPPPPGPLSRIGRRSSISVPQGLDLLKIAEYFWQAKPQINSSFDDLAEAGVADACPSPIPPARRRTGQVTSPNRSHLNYEPVHSESEEISDYEAESPIQKVAPPTPPISQRRARVGISFDPKATRIVHKKKKKKGELDDDTEICLKPLATRRNSGVLPLRIADSNYLKSDPDDGETTDDESHRDQHSPPPTNGIASIKFRIKEKLHSVPIPRIFHRKKAHSQYKLQAFVAILFLIIILLVGSIYVLHKEKELQKSYYDRIRFSSKDRRIRLSNQKGKDILNGMLGTNLNKKDKAYPCLSENERVGHTCLEWMNKARLYFRTQQHPELPLTSVNETSTSLRCYEILWKSLNPDFEPKDCFNLGEKSGGHFYGGGEIPGSNHWPLNKTNIQYSPFLTGSERHDPKKSFYRWGRTLRRLFVNSEGAAIKISDNTPLHVSINQDGDRKLCIGAKTYGYEFESNNKNREKLNGPMAKKSPPDLNYTLCSGASALETAEFLTHKDIWDGLKHEDIQATRLLAQSILWKILPETINHGHYSESALLNYTDRIMSLSLNKGYLLFDESFQKKIGDLEMDPYRFPTMDETLNITRRRGFKVALTVQPFFSTQSLNYEEGLNVGKEGGVWLAEKHPETKNVPALTQYKNWTSVAVIDATKFSACDWFEKKVSALVEKYKLDALFVDVGTADDLPQFYEFFKPLASADYYKDLILKSLRPIQSVRTIGVSSAVKLPKLPTFVSLSPTESSWEGLQSVIPNVLTMGVSGYPFIMPGAIGGDFFPSSMSNVSYRTSSKGSFRVPDRELYIRWMELVHFLPVVQYSYLPSDYDSKVVEIATTMHNVRKNKLYPYIKKAIDEALTSGLPIIRPLWMIDPNDPNCLKVADEFAIGSDIIVAPVLTRGEEYRDIYLPKGIWRNEMDGPTKGEKWLHHYKVKEDQIPYFIKIQDVHNIEPF